MPENIPPEKIAEKNDHLRKNLHLPHEGLKVYVTRGVAALNPLARAQVLDAVRTFDDFNEGNDPYGEHDFGKVVVDGEAYFWKFDYYDDDYMYHKKDGNRVLTIMRSDEY